MCFVFGRTIPSLFSITMGMQRWCPCGFVAVWRRDELSWRSDSSDFFLPSDRDGPGCLPPSLWTLLKSFRVWKQGMLYVRIYFFNITSATRHGGVCILLRVLICAQSKRSICFTVFFFLSLNAVTTAWWSKWSLFEGSEMITFSRYCKRLSFADDGPQVNVKVFFCEWLPIICAWVTNGVIYYLSKLKLSL